MLCRDAATLAAPIEPVGEVPTPAAFADFLFKQISGHDAQLARVHDAAVDNLRRAVVRVVCWCENPGR
jgi:hypothetical protein